MSDQEVSNAQEKLRREFNRWAEAGRGDEMAGEHSSIAEGMLARMSFAEREKILDVGCGAGWFVARLAQAAPGGQVVGIDVADEMIRQARRKYVDLSNVIFVEGSAEEIPWDECFFNKVVSIESAYYWPDIDAAFGEIFRVLQPGGSVWILINLCEENEMSHPWQDKLGVRTHLLSGAGWCERLRAAGFTDTRHELVPDLRPVPDDHVSQWFRDAEELRRFREKGALLATGTRPELK